MKVWMRKCGSVSFIWPMSGRACAHMNACIRVFHYFPISHDLVVL